MTLVERLLELRLHDYVALDFERAIEALDGLDRVEEFAEVVAARLEEAPGD